MTDQRVHVKASFNTAFCQLLEYHLSKAFANSSDKKLKYFWCDGIDEPLIEQQFTSRNITSIKEITTQARLGSTGQDKYQMIIVLGLCSRRRALKGEDISSCLPYTDIID
jgi:hypothetical protein